MTQSADQRGGPVMISVRPAWSRPQARAAARRLADAIAERLGPERVVFGTDLETADATPLWTLRRDASEAAAVVAVIDPEWAEAMDDRLGPLSQGDAIVRMEIGAAALSGAPVVLATLDLAPPPRRDQLSPELARLADAPIAPLRDACLEEDLTALADRLARMLRPGASAAAPLTVARSEDPEADADRAWRALGPAPTAEQIRAYVEIYGDASRPRAGLRWRLFVAWLLFAATALAVAVEVMSAPPPPGSRESR